MLVTALIYLHATAGGIGLLSGFTSAASRKGNRVHRSAGKLFVISMSLSAFLALIISIWPGHESAFLFSIGIFTLYLVLTGNRAILLRRKKQPELGRIDYALTLTMMITGILMIAFALFQFFTNKPGVGIVLMVFGLIGLLNAKLDFSFYKRSVITREDWLARHIGRIGGALIAATTAFVVVNMNTFFSESVPDLVGWLGPTVIGSIYLSYWTRKIRQKPA